MSVKCKIYVCHYDQLKDRREYLDIALENLNFPYIIKSDFNRKNVTEFNSYFSNDLSLRFPYWRATDDPKMSPSVRATTLEHIKIFEAIINDTEDVFLILEDDAIFSDNFEVQFEHVINNLPPLWDVVYLTSGCSGREHIINQNINQKYHTLIKISNRNSWTTNAYLINKTTAKKYLNEIFPVVLPIDHELEFIQRKLNMDVYWSQKPLVFEGSNPNAKKHYVYTSSQKRNETI